MADTSVATTSIRGELLKLFRNTRSRKADLAAGEFSELQAVCEEADELSDRVKTARDNALSSGVFLDLSEAGFRRTNKLTQDKDLLTPSEFVSMLKSKFVSEGQGSENMNWKRMGEVAGSTIKCDVGVDCMLGALEVESKVSAPRRKNPRTKEASITQPKSVKGDVREDISVNQQTDKIMETMYRVLSEAKEPIPVVELVLNHDSFSQTVENLFTLSFLVKDRRVDFSHDEELGVLVSKRKRQNQRGQGPSVDPPVQPKKQQGVMAIDWDVFEDMKSIAFPEDCRMPKRPLAIKGMPGNSSLTDKPEIIPSSGEESPPVHTALSHPPEGTISQEHQTKVGETREQSVVDVRKCERSSKSVTSKKRNKCVGESTEATSRKARRVLEHSDCLINSPLNK